VCPQNGRAAYVMTDCRRRLEPPQADELRQDLAVHGETELELDVTLGFAEPEHVEHVHAM
jgi:hypothetical protein